MASDTLQKRFKCGFVIGECLCRSQLLQETNMSRTLLNEFRASAANAPETDQLGYTLHPCHPETRVTDQGHRSQQLNYTLHPCHPETRVTDQAKRCQRVTLSSSDDRQVGKKQGK